MLFLVFLSIVTSCSCMYVMPTKIIAGLITIFCLILCLMAGYVYAACCIDLYYKDLI